MLRRLRKLQRSSPLLTTNYSLLTTRKGSLLLDALLSVAIFGVIVGAFSSGISGGQQGTLRGGNRTRAAYLAEEGLEALRSIRDKVGGFAVITGRTPDEDDGVQLVGSDWTIVDTPLMIDNLFTRKVVFSAGPDANTRKVTSTVFWTEIPGNQLISVSVESYLTNWQSNPAPPAPDWSIPILRGALHADLAHEETTLEDIEVVGNYAFAANSSGVGNGLIIYDISNLTSPTFGPIVSVGAAANDIAVSGNYAYLATNDATNELKILDISNPLSVTCCIGQVDLSGNGFGRGLFITGSYLYVAREQSTGPELYVYDISTTPTAPILVAQIESDTPPGSTRNMFAIYPGTAPYVYTATNELTNELTASNTTTSLITGGGEVPGGLLSAKSVLVFNNGVFLGGGGTTSAYELFSFDISSTPENPNTVVGNYDTGAQPADSSEAVNDIAASPSLSLAFMATDTRQNGDNHYFQVLDISTLNNLDSLTKRIYDGTIAAGYDTYKGIFYRESDHTAFVVGGQDFPGSDLIILQPTYN